VDQITQIAFASGEGVQLGGWDGFLITESRSAYVPQGQSVWELGVNKKTKEKADDDYEKRKKDPLGLNPAETTYIFVTPRRWGGKDDWVAERQKEGFWKEVRAYDAGDLETWLELAPAVHLWISILAGKHPVGVQDLESTWADWSQAATPAISSDLVLAGRSGVAEQLHTWIRNDPSVQTLHAESRAEALAVFAASVEQLSEDDRNAVYARAVVIEDVIAWRQLIASSTPLLLIPMFDDRGSVNRAVQNGHHVLVPLGRSDAGSLTSLEVPRLSREQAQAALVAMGLPETRASTLAGIARRSMTSLRRRMAPNPEVQQPEWAKPAEGGALVPALLAGSWNGTTKGDREVVGKLGRAPYDQVSRILQRWANESDPPVRKIGDTWFLVSREDAWELLARLVTRDDLDTFREVVLEVLGTPDPKFDLPENEWHLARVHGHKLPHSGLLRQGLAETLAHLGAESDRPSPSDVLPAGFIAGIVHQLLDRANKDWRLWTSLSEVLPLLAEAAPAEFLEAVESGVSGETPVLLKMFATGDDPLFTSSPHTGLLWALETLAWSAEHLSQATRLLAKLAILDPGGRLTNRPDNSLRGIYLPWRPSTAASSERRLKVLDALRTWQPDVAWKVLISLLPEGPHGVAFQTAAPHWRDWVPNPRPNATWPEIEKAYGSIVERLLADVGTDGKRWRALLKRFDHLPAAQVTAIADRLGEIDPNDFDDDEREEIWNQLRMVVERHREFPDALWTMSEDQVDHLESVRARFEPSDLMHKFAHLFGRGPIRLATRGEGWRENHKMVEDARQQAARELAAHGGIDYLLRTATEIEDAFELGAVLGRSNLLEDDEQELLPRGLAAPIQAHQFLVRGFVVGRSRSRGISWVDQTLSVASSSWTPAQAADFFLALPFEGQTWDRVEAASEDVDARYWSQVVFPRLEDSAECNRAAQALLDHGRPHPAVELLGTYADEEEAKITPSLAVDALTRAVRAPLGEDVHLSMYSYYVGQLLDFLETSGAVEQQQIAAIEWGFLEILRHDRPPRQLYGELARNPEFFVEVLSFVFRGEDEERGEVSAEDQLRAQMGYHLLDAWHSLPGLQEDGSVDEAVLQGWVSKVRELAGARGRGRVADSYVGKVLASAPVDPDGDWPHAAVRNMLEMLESKEVETGFEIAIHNSRGVVTRSLNEGGVQERALAEKYRKYAEALGDQWPRTAAVLRRVSVSYQAEADEEDREAEFREDMEH
jgi:hypothetical protein